MKKRSYLMPLAAMLVMIFTVSCSKETIDSVVVEDKDTTKPGTLPGGNVKPGADVDSGDGMVNDPDVDGWGDGDSSDIIVS